MAAGPYLPKERRHSVKGRDLTTGPEPSQSIIKALEHYESQEADRFYLRVWAGEDIFIGIGMFESAGDTVYDACRRTVKKMAALLPELGPGARGLELGSGYGAAARYLANDLGFHIDCLNLSLVQNQQNRQINQDRGLGDRIDVVDGSFEDIPFGAQTYDFAWSQDGFLHSSDRRNVLEEVGRVLKPGGHLVFTDLIQDEDCPPEVLEQVLARFELESLGTVNFYRESAKELGWRELEVIDLSGNLVTHYERLLQELERRHDELLGEFREEFLEGLRNGMQSWVTAGKKGNFKWAMFHYQV